MKGALCLAVLVCVAQCIPTSQDDLEDFSNFLLKTSSLDLRSGAGTGFDEVVSDNAWEESGKFEGDLILNDRQRKVIVENVKGLSRNGLTDITKRWPNKEVLYIVHWDHFTGAQQQVIEDAINTLANESCVKFRPHRAGDGHALVIQSRDRGCFAQVGYQGGYQVLNLSNRDPVGRGCFRPGTVVHELLHSLGFYHMHTSPDRDHYIDVVWSNIKEAERNHFRKYSWHVVSDFGADYDYDSILHYSRRAFSRNGRDTIVPKKKGARIGQRLRLSDKDKQKLKKMYCDEDNYSEIHTDETTAKKPKSKKKKPSSKKKKPKIKKKKPKNQSMEDHGTEYHQVSDGKLENSSATPETLGWSKSAEEALSSSQYFDSISTASEEDSEHLWREEDGDSDKFMSSYEVAQEDIEPTQLPVRFTRGVTINRKAFAS